LLDVEGVGRKRGDSAAENDLHRNSRLSARANELEEDAAVQLETMLYEV
jgi:hypothetical protein